MRNLRVVVLGDELLTGAGDPKGLGWLGRVQARIPQGDDVAVFPLAKIGETTAQLLDRWQAEALPRFSKETENYLVLALSSQDILAQTTISRSRLNLASLLDEVSELNAGFADVVKRRQLKYVDCFSPLKEHEGWLAEVSNHPRRLPGQVGYGLMAWLVLNKGWFEWLGMTEPQS
jgi:lysophospholipase L1-like esterase